MRGAFVVKSPPALPPAFKYLRHYAPAARAVGDPNKIFPSNEGRRRPIYDLESGFGGGGHLLLNRGLTRGERKYDFMLLLLHVDNNRERIGKKQQSGREKIPFLSESTCFSPILKEGEKDENLDKTACCFLLLFFLNPILVFCSISETTALYEAQKEDKEARLEWGGVDGRGKTDYGKRNFIFLLAAVALLGG